MRPIRRLLTATVAVMAGASMIVVPGSAGAEEACTDGAALGCWSAPFSEAGLFDERPPQTPEEAGALPTAVSIAVLPSGRVIYWDGLSGLADSNVALPLDAGRTGQAPDRTRILDLGEAEHTGVANPSYGTDPLWVTPLRDNGGSPENLFCSDQRLLADGRLVAAGGTNYETSDDLPLEAVDPDYEVTPDGLAELYGSKNTRLFSEDGDAGDAWNWDGDQETAVGPSDMHRGRWYPSLVTLSDGEILAVGGVSKLLWNTSVHDERASGPLPVNVVETETFDPGSNTWTLNPESANKSLPLYARVHLLPNGEVFYTGAGQMWGPAGESVDELSWITRAAYDPAAKGWRDMGIGPVGARNGAFSTMLPLKAPFDQARFLVAGGTLGVSPGLYLGTTFSELITVADNGAGDWEASSELTGDLNNARWFSTGVLLPTGQVLAFNGGDKDEVVAPGSEQAVRQAELFDPATGEWTALSSGSRDRIYHNTAILLPDGSVLVGGHSPINFAYGGTGDNSLHDMGLTANNFRDPSFEIFKPPYLFAGDRPVLKTAPNNAVLGGTIGLTVDTAAPAIDRVVLQRMPSLTHTVDADMRSIELDRITQQDADPGFFTGGSNLTIRTPDDADVLPPGYYYIWAISADGVPSVAKIISIA